MNPGPIKNDYLKDNWKTFRNRGLHFMHWDVSSRKNENNDKLRELVKISNPMVIGIAETKIDNLIGDSEISSANTVILNVIQTKGGHVICT